jgi:type II secretion system protein L
MSRQILAIDIRDDCLAAVLLNTGLKSSVVQSGLYMPLANESGENDPLGAAIKSIVEKIQASNANVVVSIPTDKAIFRTLRVPFSDEKKIRQILPFELEPILPQQIDNLVIDYLPGRNGDQNEILTVAIDHETLKGYLGSFESVHIRPQLIVPGAFPLAMLVAANMPELPDQAILMDLDTQKSTIFLIQGKHTVLVRTFASQIHSQANVEMMATRVRQTLTSFSDTQAIDFKPEMVLLSGPGLAEESAVDRLSEALGMPTKLVDIRLNVPKVEMDRQLQDWQPALMNNALTLGLLEAEGRSCPNFHRSRSPLRNYWNSYRSYVRGPAVLLSLLFLLWIAGALVDNHLLQNQVQLIDRQMEDVFQSVLPDARRVGDPLDQMKSEIKNLEANAIGGDLDLNNARSIDVLFQVSRSIPSEMDVVFSRLVIGDNEVTISGETASFKVVDDIKVRLEQNDLFKKVTIASANMDKGGDKVRFKLTINL